MTRLLILLSICLAACGGMAAAHAQAPGASGAEAPSDTTVAAADTTLPGVAWAASLPNLTVTAARMQLPPETAPARVTVLDSSAMAQTGAASVSDLLDARAGLHVRQYGDGGLATMSLRGTGSAQTLVLLDGHPIADPQLGQLDLSLLPSVMLQSVEVMHGPASPLYGSAGMGGAVHLRTLRPSDALIARVSTSAGAFGARGGSAVVGGRTGGVSLLAAGEARTTDGDFPYRDRSAFPPRTVRRQNADRDRYTAFASARARGGMHRWHAAGWLTHAERGLPGPVVSASSSERQRDTQMRLWGGNRVQTGWGSVEASGLVQHTRLHYANPDRGIDNLARTWSADVDLQAQAPVAEAWMLTSGLNGSFGRALHPSLAASGARQWHAGAFASGLGTYGRLRLYPAVRVDAFLPPAAPTRVAVSPRLGLNLQPVDGWADLHWKAHAGRTFRMPTFNDRFWQPGGNPDLRPERGWSVDTGLHLSRARWSAEATVFANWRRDQIVWAPVRSGTWTPENEERVRARGVELSASVRQPLTSSVSLDAGLTYTYTDARNRSTPGSPSYDAPLRYLPREQAKAHASLAVGPVALNLNARYTGRRYISSDGSRYLDPFVLVDAGLRLSHRFDDVRAQLSARVDNAADTDYRAYGNRPMPPRHLRVRLMVSL